MRIAFDLDEVLGEFIEPYLRYYNERHGTSWTRERFHSYHFWDVLGGTREDAIAFTEEFVKTEHFTGIRPVEGATDAIAALGGDHTLILITSRPDKIQRETEEWLERHFPGAFSQIHLTNQFAKEGYWRSKADVCAEEKVDVMVEDSLEYARECAEKGVRVLLLDAPWNQGALPDGIIRVRSWDEIAGLLSRRGP